MNVKIRLVRPRLLAVCVRVFLLSGFLHTTARAQTNSWITPASDKWETATNWSLGIAPTNSQSVFITNSISKTVTINSVTSGNFSNTLTVNTLSISSPDSSTNTLLVSSTFPSVTLTILDSLSVSNGGVLAISGSAVNVIGITNGNVSLGGNLDNSEWSPACVECLGLRRESWL